MRLHGSTSAHRMPGQFLQLFYTAGMLPKSILNILNKQCLFSSKYSKIKLGKDDDKPEYSDTTWVIIYYIIVFGIYFS